MNQFQMIIQFYRAEVFAEFLCEISELTMKKMTTKRRVLCIHHLRRIHFDNALIIKQLLLTVNNELSLQCD